MDPVEKHERLREATIALLAGAAGRQLNTVVFNKAMFYFDLTTMLELGHAATGNAYIALPMGPVIAKYPDRLQRLAREGVVDLAERGNAKPIRLVSDAPTWQHLTSEHLALVPGVLETIGRMSATDASDYSHLNPGWIAAKRESDRLGKPQSIDMLIAMQQLADDDDWLARPIDNDDHASTRDARTATITW
jgi:uncharacterized phage-associated protein